MEINQHHKGGGGGGGGSISIYRICDAGGGEVELVVGNPSAPPPSV